MASGDPESPLRWRSKTVRMLATNPNVAGHAGSRQLVSELLAGASYRLPGIRKTREGTNHPDRDEQFRFLNRQMRNLQGSGKPVITMDTKRKELTADYKTTENSGCRSKRRSWFEFTTLVSTTWRGIPAGLPARTPKVDHRGCRWEPRSASPSTAFSPASALTGGVNR